VVLLSQGLPPSKQSGSAIAATLSTIENLGYIQIDTISAIQRAHHHTIWNRNPRYENSHLDTLLRDKKLFEYWSHAASYLPMRDFRYSLIRKQAIASGEMNHWYAKDKNMMSDILKRITDEGPLMAKDFKHNKKVGEWNTKPAKQALEYLFMQGDLMIPYRINFHKVYDLTERVLDTNIDTSMPTQEEYGRFLITRYLQANGIGQAAEMPYLLKNTKQLVSSILPEMIAGGDVTQINVCDTNYYALPNSLELLSKPLARSKLKILSPFDNLLIQRKRMKALFNFDYQIECYLPAAKRQYGYFSLPILWDGKLVARMDCKADRKTSILHIHHIALEASLKKTDAFAIALHKELTQFMIFNGCDALQLHKTTPTSFKAVLEEKLRVRIQELRNTKVDRKDLMK
jgi:uncharacterized protein YcaQ